jgi:flagellar basal-body rod modification protein FlgD
MVSGVTTDTAAAASYMKKTTGLNKDDFMKLFVTQLRNQDPLNPTDSSAMVAQMAQLTQVEQAYNTNTNLTSLLTALNGQSNLSAVSYIGKTITAPGSDLQLASGGTSQVNYSLGTAANQVNVTIKDSTGSVVRVLTGGSSSAGEGSLAWDGLNSSGAQASAGAYTFSVTGTRTDGTVFNGTSLVKGVVSGVRTDQSTPVLQTGGIDVPLANVTGVRG